MVSLLRKFVLSSLIIFLTSFLASFSWGAALTVTYASGHSSGGKPVLFNMVPNSPQQLQFNITSAVPNVIFTCSVTSSSMDTINLVGGCTNVNGAATPAPLIVTIQSGTTPGPVSHTLTIQTLSGSQVINIPLNYRITTDSSRTITFKNYCPFKVWFGVATGTEPPACTTTADCPAGTQCSGGQCFWIPPTPNNIPADPTKAYELGAYSGSGAPASNSITIPDYSAQNSLTKLWSGGFAGRTGCTFSGGAISCETGDCGDDGTGQGGCALGTGFAAPVTQAEPTFNVSTPDAYDVTIINGMNVPISFSPSTIPPGTSSPYDCGAPGKIYNTSYVDVLYSTTMPSPTGTLGGCPWVFAPPGNNLLYQWVSGTPGGGCTQDTDCGGLPNACGLTTANVNANTATLSCGKFLGYWTQDEICATNSSFSQSSIVDCTSTSQITNCTANGGNCPVTVAGQYTFFNLLACTSSPPDVVDNKLTFASCFAASGQSASSINCCGCSNWQNTPGFTGKVPTDSALVPQCNSSATTTANSNWRTSVLPNLTWLKNACPSAYTYPYDDKTSGFGCPYAFETGQSAVNYTVTFCPGQKTGK